MMKRTIAKQTSCDISMTIRVSIVVALAIQCLSVFAAPEQQYAAILEQAVSSFDENYQQSWAYTEESTRAGVTRTGRFDPSLPLKDRWQLLSIDGRPPAKKEISKYLKEKKKRAEEARDEGQGPDSLLAPETLELIEETDDYWLFNFLPTSTGDRAEMMEYLDGKLRITKKGTTIEYIDIRSKRAFKPRFGVRIKGLVSYFEFRRAAVEGPMVPSAMEFRIHMKALGLINVNEQVKIQYSDYEYVGEKSIRL